MPDYTVDCNYTVIRNLPRIGTPQSLDLGWNVLLLSRNRCFHKIHHCSKKDLKCTKILENPVSGMLFNCEPLDTKYMIFRSRVIYICDSLSLRAIIPVIVHEVSHLVDKILDAAGVIEVDTEIRAYLNDYYCDKLFDMMSFDSGKEKVKTPIIEFRLNKKLLEDKSG